MEEDNKSPQFGDENRKGFSTVTPQRVEKFVNPGMVLFADHLLTALGAWIYWLVVSKFVVTSEIGHATTIYSLVLLVNTVAQLGLEYPLLKKSIAYRQQIFGTVAVIELLIAIGSIPLILYATGNLYQQSEEFTWIAIGILVLSSMGFVSRFALLGLSMSKTILVLDILGTTLKFGSAIAFISAGYGAMGILLSFLIQAAVVTGGTSIVAGRLFGIAIGNLSFVRVAIKDGLVNFPSKLSGMLIVSLSVVLLASLGVDSSEVGVFYMAMMVSIVVGSFSSSLAFMSIPASSAMNKDLSSSSLRIGLAFTAPIIAILIVAPGFVLSVIGTEYSMAGDILVVLAIGVLPSVILSNAMSRFNNQNKPRKLLAIGSLRVVAFLVAFFALVPQFGTMGAAYSILISFTTSAVLSLIWTEKASLRFIGISVLSIIVGVVAAQVLTNTVQAHPVIAICMASSVSLFILFSLRCTSTKEIGAIISAIRKVEKN